MTPERWQQIKDVFNSALEYEPAQRQSFLSQACDKDPELREEVESLLVAHEKDGSFIDSPAYVAAGALGLEDGPSVLKTGQLLGDYEITAFIGRGGMGEVYLAQDRRLRRKVALKLLPSLFTKDENRLHRFEQEARAASALNHPNIITIYEIREAASSHIIATEFVEGETLRNRLNRLRLSVSETLNVAIQVADALSAAHKAGIIHRDIKPENIMIRPDGYVKVLDFGLAKLSEPKSAASFMEASTHVIQTGSGVVIGTVGYMSPEQARGQTVDARSDVFSLGAVIYEMVAGVKPFSGETPSDTFAALLKTEPPALLRIAPDTPAELVRIVTKALRKDREERYQVVKDLLLDLKSLKEELEFQAKLDRSVATTGKEDTHIQAAPATGEINAPLSTFTHSLSVELKRHKTGALLVAGALALLIAAGGIALYKLLNLRGSQTVAGPKVLKTLQVTYSSGLDGFPSLSPDGKSVAYSSDKSGNFEIYVKQLSADGGEIQLTNDGQQNFHPSWSSDGQRLAYYSRKRGGIWVVPALGGTARQLTDTGANPAWSPDGSLIAFQSVTSGEVFTTRAMPPSTIWIIPSQGGTPKQISRPSSPAGGHSSPSWSPDGKRIVFEVSDYITGSVWSMAIDGRDPRKLTDGRQPVYGGDGNVYFMAGDRAASDLFRIRVSAVGEPIGEPTLAVQAGAGAALDGPTISRDGKKILYSVERTMSNLWSIPLSPNGDVAGPPSTFASDTSSRNSLPRFSPDGRKIALNKWRPTSGIDVWIADADSKNFTQLTNNPGIDSQVSWLPGGDKLAFLSARDNQHLKLWTVSISTGRQEPMLDLGEGVQFALVSPDGNQVAYNFIQNGIMNVWTASVADGTRKQMTFENEMSGFPCWSPDSKLIAYEKKHGENDYLMVIPRNGGQPVQLNFDKGKSWPHSFSGDGDKIIFAGQRDGIWNIYSISISTKVQKQLTNYSKLNSFVRYPSWSRNQIVYEYAETTGNLWMVELE